MDLNKNIQFPHASELSKGDGLSDTTLCLNFIGFEGNQMGRLGGTQNGPGSNFSGAPDDGCRLVLGLGPTPSVYCNNYYSVEINTNKDSASLYARHMSSDDNSILKLGLSGGASEAKSEGYGSLSMGIDAIIDTPVQKPGSFEDSKLIIPIVDEGSSSARKSGGYMPSLLLAPRMKDCEASKKAQDLVQLGSNPTLHSSHELSSQSNFSLSAISEQTTTTTTSSEQRSGGSKKCKFSGCTKGARGASGLCIGHGGGQRCQKPGCNKGAESRTAYCKAHGGGNRCQHLGCTKSAEGKTDFCIGHGGGKRCGFLGGCSKAARGKSGLCIRHGGGKRCKVESCTRSAEGQAGLCISHGGGRRCQFSGCSKGAQGSTMYCKAHGGGKRCIFAGCTKGAEGSTPLCKAHGGGKRCLYDGGGICPKSVHGGTNFCVAHGGGKRCAVPGCTKSARGRTDCCVRHGGGKRCRFENCGKSAQGSTDFCKAHGGGKRCTWGDGKCEKFARGRSGLCAAHGSMLQQREVKKGSLIAPGLFHGLVPAASTAGSSFDNTSSVSGASFVSDSSINSSERPAKMQQMIPPQVLVPLSMKSASSYSSLVHAGKPQEESCKGLDDTAAGFGSTVNKRGVDFLIPEGRVHGGGLMSLLGGNLNNPIDGI